MHCYAYLLLGMLGATACQAQSDPPQAARTEFGPTTNGLIYPPQTMGKLRHIVDSLNLRHKVCDLQRHYRSLRQGQAYYVRLEQGNVDEARRALAGTISPDEFKARFPQALVDRNLLVISFTEDKQVSKKSQATVYRSIPFNNQGEYQLQAAGAAPSPGGWVVEHQEKTSYSAAYVEAFYFPAGLTQSALPGSYANLVQYADCLIDTTAQIYLEAAKRTGRPYRAKTPSPQQAFMQYAHEQTQRPSLEYNKKLTDKQMEARWAAYHQWDSLRLQKMDRLAQTPRFRELLTRAATDPSNQGASDEEFEEYVARYYSPKAALGLKRSRIVVGGCSQDDSPRRHALSIAQLSAETINWETFLRAHLDIMNDRFERVSDGSYAWAARQTYLRELEELDINVPDLMLGISLRIDNPSQNHYFGSLGRLGRALAETRQPRELEHRLLQMVADPGLDTYNRVLAYYLFLNYNHHLPDKTVQTQNVAKLNVAVQQLPAYLVARAVVPPQK